MRATRVIILGSTGSIGTQTLEVIAHLNAMQAVCTIPEHFEVVGLACGRNTRLAEEQRRRFGCGRIVYGRDGPEAAAALVANTECDVVVAAMVGSAGIRATLAAAERGRTILLANKETLVAAGALIAPLATERGARLLPLDSEHAALWQCLGLAAAPPLSPMSELRHNIVRVILTASGGPFRTWTRDAIRAALPAQALRHPTWTMGRKVTIDSASLMNKALEIMEAHWLFGIPAARIEALIHPQSLVHAMAEFVDGNIMAQLAAPDMRTPIQHALMWPRRVDGVARRLDWMGLRQLEFEPVDAERFPLLALGHRALAAGGTAGAVLNGANEAAVGAFLDDAHPPLPFGALVDAVLETVEAVPVRPMHTLDDCLGAESEAREYVLRRLRRPVAAEAASGEKKA